MGFFSKVLGNATEDNLESLLEGYGKLLCEGEEIELGFSLFRDTFMFTNKRILIAEVHDLVGKRVSYLSIPYQSITRFSVETSGLMDIDVELKIWVGSMNEPSVVKTFSSSIDVYEVQKKIAEHI